MPNPGSGSASSHVHVAASHHLTLTRRLQPGRMTWTGRRDGQRGACGCVQAPGLCRQGHSTPLRKTAAQAPPALSARTRHNVGVGSAGSGWLCRAGRRVTTRCRRSANVRRRSLAGRQVTRTSGAAAGQLWWRHRCVPGGMPLHQLDWCTKTVARLKTDGPSSSLVAPILASVCSLLPLNRDHQPPGTAIVAAWGGRRRDRGGGVEGREVRGGAATGQPKLWTAAPHREKRHAGRSFQQVPADH